MRIRVKGSYVLIESEHLIRLISMVSATKIIAGAFFPFVIIDPRAQAKTKRIAINHELIHFAQQKEMLFIGAWLLRLSEIIYFRLMKRKTRREAYILHCSEQEAYCYGADFNYLIDRRRYAHIREFLRNKKVDLSDLPMSR